MGEYPTEHVYYTTLAMLGRTAGAASTPLTGPISLNPAVDGSLGFRDPAVGALLTIEQSWLPRSITLGQMLHSLALAPGEATRIAVIDWERRTTATATEEITESEQLDAAAQHNRGISEIQNAVADELQRGESMNSGWAHTESTSSADTDSSGLLGSGLFGGDSGSTTNQSADTAYGARSASWTLGHRSVAASMTQRVNDRTEQHATAVRNRRASAVREVSQAEHEQISTRIVANYNHMHALTVQYYEVVQIYEVFTRMIRADRCLFLPVDLPSFRGPAASAIVDRFRGALHAAALTARIRELLIGPANVTLIAHYGSPPAGPGRLPSVPNPAAVGDLGVWPIAAVAATKAANPVPHDEAGAAAERTTAAPVRIDWARVLGKVAGRTTVYRAPADADLIMVTCDGPDLSTVGLISQRGGATGQVQVPVAYGAAVPDAPLPMSDLTSITVSRTDASGAITGALTLQYNDAGRTGMLGPVPFQLTAGARTVTVAEIRSDHEDREHELLAHLQANAAYYGQAVLRSLDPATLALLLQPYAWNDRPVMDQIEPAPVAVLGNYLVFRAPAEPADASGLPGLTWEALLAERGIDATGRAGDHRQVAVQTGGVFAEAVLGRSNSAEKLDITRFWNWQDSPIPLAPPEIAPVQSGSRQAAENLAPGQLGAPVLSVTPAVSLPDPAGVGAALQALANGAMFRDMSGLAGTQQAAVAGAQAATAAQSAAAAAASQNLQAEIARSIALAQVAGDVGKAAMGIPPTGSGKVDGISGDGARINHGRDLDERAGTGADATKGPPPSSGTAGAKPTPRPGAPASGSPAVPAGAVPAKGTAPGGAKPKTGNRSAASREQRFADQGAHNFSPDAIADLAAAPGGTSIEFEGMTVEPGVLLDENSATTTVNVYLQSSMLTLAGGYNLAFTSFAVWYRAFEQKRSTLAHPVWKILLEETFGAIVNRVIPEGGLFMDILKGAAQDSLQMGLTKLDASPDEVDKLLDDVFEKSVLPYLRAVGTVADTMSTESPQAYDDAIEFVMQDANDPRVVLTRWKLPPRAQQVLDEAGFLHPDNVEMMRVAAQVLTDLITVIAKHTTVTTGESFAHFGGFDEHDWAEIEALALLDPKGNMDRICQLERLIDQRKYCTQ